MRKTFLFFLSITLSFLLIFCSKSGNNKSRKSNIDHLVIISPHENSVKENFIPAFRDWYFNKTKRQVKVEWLTQGGTSDNLRYIRSQFKKYPGGIGIDMMWGGGISPYLKLKQEGLLEKVDIDQSIKKAIPGKLNGISLYDKDGYWYGSCLAGFGIIYNKMVLNYNKLSEPRKWKDMINPKLLGWISCADPRHSGSSHVAFDTILQAYGWDKGWDLLTKIGANVKRFTISSQDVIKDVVSGDVACGFCVDYFAWKAVKDFGGSKIGFVFPEDGLMVNPDCFAILKGTQNYKVAKMFMEFVLSVKGQKIWMLPEGAVGGPTKSSIFRLSIRPDVYDMVKGKTFLKINPFKIKATFNYDINEAEVMWGVFNDLFGAIIVDNHDLLVKAWKSIQSIRQKDNLMKTFVKVPINLKTAKDYSNRWDDEIFRNKKIDEWLNFASQKYNKVIELVKEN